MGVKYTYTEQERYQKVSRLLGFGVKVTHGGSVCPPHTARGLGQAPLGCRACWPS